MALEQAELDVVIPFKSKGRLVVSLENFLDAKINAATNILDTLLRHPNQKVSKAEMLESEKEKLAQQFGFDDGE